MSYEEVNSLFVGGDETNGNKGVLGFELLLLAFSIRPEDGIVEDWGNRQDLNGATKWSNSLFTNYGLILIENEDLLHYRNNLARYIVPGIEKFLSTRPHKLKKMSIYLDGRLERGGRSMIKNEFKTPIPEIVVDNFPRKTMNSHREVQKRHICPRVTYYADSLLTCLIQENSRKEDFYYHPKLLLRV